MSVNTKDRGQQKESEKQCLDIHEYHALVSGMENEKWRLLTEFLVQSGLRIKELVSLKKEDIEGNILHIRGTNDGIKSRNSVRDVRMQPELLAVVEKINHCMTGIQSDLFFPDADGERLRYNIYNEYLCDAAQKICGRRITVYDLRNAAVFHMVGQGYSMEDIAKRFG